MGLSVNKFTYDGTDEFDLNFAAGYTSPSDVTAVINTDPLVDLGFDWLTDSRVRLAAGHSANIGDELIFRRTVSKTALPVDLSQPGEATRENLQTLAEHLLYISHEVLDDRTADVHPWETLGSAVALEEALDYDYLLAYTGARDAV